MDYIKSFDELMNMDSMGEYALACDIDCGGETIKCISGDFSGKLNGYGHKISNLVLSDEIWGDEQTLALFYSLSKAEISDITFDKVSVLYEPICYHPRVSALAGNCSNSTITNVSVILDKVTEELALIYDANDCKIENVSIIKDGKKGQIAKYC